MINWHLIDKEEKSALARYARLLGMSPQTFAQLKIMSLKIAEKQLQLNHASIGGRRIPPLRIDRTISSVDALIALTRRANKSRIKELSLLVSRHLKAYSHLYAINVNSLTARARDQGIQPGKGNWIAEYLQRVPVVTPFTPDIDAFVDLFPEGMPKIVVSENLHNVFEIALIPLVFNMLSDNGKAFPVKPRRLTPDMIRLAKDVIAATVRTYLHQDVNALASFVKPKIGK